MPPADREPVAGTTARFILLITVLSVCSATMLTDSVIPVTRYNGESLGCGLAAGLDPGASHLQNELALIRHPQQLRDCTYHYAAITPWWWPALAVAGVFALAALLFFAIPAWRGRRGRVVPLDPDDDLRELVGIAGVRPMPRFAVDPAAPRVGAVVFGRPGRYTVRLSGGLVARRRTDPDVFRAVILHELAHLRNGDVVVTYATVALWRAFLAVVLLPYAAHQLKLVIDGFHTTSPFWPGVRPMVTRDLLLSAFLVVLVFLARADILRVREIYADVAAVRWGADPHVWARHGEGPVRRLARLLSTHPRWDERRLSLTNRTAIFGVAALPLFLTGASALLVSALLPDLAATFLVADSFREPVAVWLATALVTLTTGRAIWRSAWYAARKTEPARWGEAAEPDGEAARRGGKGARDRPGASYGLRAGLWLGLGMAAGEEMLSRTGGNHFLPRHPSALLILVALGAVTLAWTAECARVWMRPERDRGRTGTAVVIYAGLAVMALVFGSWLSWWQSYGRWLAIGDFSTRAQIRSFVLREFPPPAAGAYRHPVVVDAFADIARFEGRWPLVLTVTAMWVFPLLSRFFARSRPAPSLRGGLGAGAAGGLLCLAAVGAAMADMHVWQPPPEQRLGEYAIVYITMVIVALVAATSATGLFAVRHDLATVLLGAGIAAVLGLAGHFLLASADGCLGPLNTASTRCFTWRPAPAWKLAHTDALPVLTFGPIGAMIVALVVRAARGWWVDRRAATDEPDTVRGGGRRSRVAVIALALVAAAAGTAAAVPSGPRLGGVARQVPLAPAEHASTPKIHAWQLIAWYRYGGGRLTIRIIHDLSGIDDSVHDIATGKKPAGLAALCADLPVRVKEAGDYFPIPDSAEQQTWATVLTRLRDQGEQCKAASVAGDMKRIVTTLTAFMDTQQTLVGLLDAMDREIKPYQGKGGSPAKRVR